jgi:hypothetical protein
MRILRRLKDAVGVTIAMLISAVSRARRQRDPDPLN